MPSPVPPDSAIADCADCGTRLAGRWCHACGQRADTGRLGFLAMGRDLIDRIGQLESGMTRTVLGLLRDPHACIRGWLDGQRRRYTHPFALLLVAATLSLLSTGLMGEGFWAEFDRVVASQAIHLGDPAQVRRLVDFYRALFAALPYWMLVFTLPVAGLMRLFFPRAPLRAAEHWLAALYAVSLAILVDVPLSLGLHAAAVPVAQQLLATNLLLMLVQWWVLARFMRRGAWGAVRVMLAVVLAYVLASSLQTTAAYLYARA